jgi:hypothetical protein
MDRKTDARGFQTLLDATFELYGKPAPSDTILEIWWNALASWDFVEVREAFSVYIKHSEDGQFIPKPASIIRILQGGGAKTHAYLASTSVVRAIRSHGSYASVEFNDPRTHAVIEDMGGWHRLCETLEKDLPFVENEFRRRYEGYALREVPQETPTRCRGREELSYLEHGWRFNERKVVKYRPQEARISYSGVRPLSIPQQETKDDRHD